MIKKTGERVVPNKFTSKEEYLIYLRHVFAYKYALKKIDKNAKSLDIGTGEGYGTAMLSKKAKSVVGIDVEFETVKHAQKTYGNNTCTFQLYDGKTIPFPNSSFDIVTSFQVIEHVTDDQRFVNEIARVLKPKGVAIITTPCRTYRLKPNEKPWNRFHIREYDDVMLESILKSVFNNVSVFGIRATESAQKVEVNRIKQYKKVLALDPLNIRSIIPEWLKIPLVKLFRKVAKQKGKENFQSVFSINDYFMISENLHKSLDLLGVCKK